MFAVDMSSNVMFLSFLFSLGSQREIKERDREQSEKKKPPLIPLLLKIQHAETNGVLGKVIRAVKLLDHHLDALPLRRMLLIKGVIHMELGQHSLAVTAL